MKRILSVLILFAAFNSVFALPSFDPFADNTADGGTAYTVGSGLAGNNRYITNDWQLVNSNQSSNPEPTIVEGNLTYPDLPTSTGNSISNAPPPTATGRTARLHLRAGTAPPTAYYSLLLKVTDLTNVPDYATNGFIAGFSDTTGTQTGTILRCGGRLVFKKLNTGYVVGIGKGTTLTDYVYDTVERAIGDVVFVVVGYSRPGGATNVSLWVNPPSESFGAITPPTPTVSVPQGVATGDMNAGGIAAFVLSCQQYAMPSCIIDEVRVATNWGFVTGGNPTFPVSITSDPASRNVKTGDRVGFVLSHNGTSPTFQWRFNGVNIADATNSAYAIASADPTNAGNYTVVISNAVNSLTSAPAALTISATPFSLYETNLIVVRVGDGVQTPIAGGNSVFLDQITTNGTYLNTTFIPDSGSNAIIAPGTDVNGSVLTGTALSRSADKRLMVMAGYNTALGNTTALQTTTAENVPRGIVTIDPAGQVVLALTDTNAYSAGYFRGAASDGTNNFWGSGSIGGTYYFGLSNAAAFVQTIFPNTRSVDIFNGNLYSLASASGANGLQKFTGLPTTDQGIVPNMLPGFSSVTTTDFAVNPADTLIHLTASATIQRWEYDGTTWTNPYVINLPGPGRYLTVDYNQSPPVIYVDTGDGQLLRVVDTGPASASTLLASSGPNQLFKGIRFGPSTTVSVPQPVLLFGTDGNNLILNWSGAHTLQSSTNVTGTYVDVPSASSPYTNSTTASQQFFRLRD